MIWLSTELMVLIALLVTGVTLVACWILFQKRKREEFGQRFSQFTIEQAPDSIFWVDFDGRIQHVNPAACQALGYTLEEFKNLTVPDIDLDFHKEFFKDFIQKLKNEKSMYLYGTQKRKDGGTFPVEVRSHFIEFEGREYICAFARDITERKRAEKAHKESEALEMANEQLKELDRLKSMFIASMSHEFRTPLNSIIGFTGILLMEMVGKLEPKQKDFLKRANQSSKHLLSLVTDIIDISKIEAGKIEKFNSMFLLGKVIEEVVNAVETMEKKGGLELRMDVPVNLEIYNDRKRVYQCILNLLSNAVKYTEKGWVSISAKQHAGEVEIVVEDTGIGIAENDLPKLFQPFERLNSSLRTRELGTGLGLYLTKKIASEILRGSVKAESRLGAGSKFFLTIPMHRQSENLNI